MAADSDSQMTSRHGKGSRLCRRCNMTDVSHGCTTGQVLQVDLTREQLVARSLLFSVHHVEVIPLGKGSRTDATPRVVALYSSLQRAGFRGRRHPLATSSHLELDNNTHQESPRKTKLLFLLTQLSNSGRCINFHLSTDLTLSRKRLRMGSHLVKISLISLMSPEDLDTSGGRLSGTRSTILYCFPPRTEYATTWAPGPIQKWHAGFDTHCRSSGS
ncbi:hypothetical protein KCU74_g62, partial [Aureobasidium melanogenum]